MLEYKRDIYTLRYMLAELMERQSSVAYLSESRQKDCKEGIRALQTAIDALEAQVLA